MAAMIEQAEGWLRRRSHFTTGYLFELIAQTVHPLILVEKSPSVVYDRDALQRIRDLFPQARFLHLLRHPRSHGESVMKFIDERKKHGPMPRSHWLLYLATYPDLAGEDVTLERSAILDPQRGWYVLHTNICKFLASIPDHQKMSIRGEDLLTKPDEGLRQIANWIGLRTDDQAIDEMKHPERSPYACFGPLGAQGGNDPFFLENPVLRPEKAMPLSLDGLPGWCRRPHGFLPKVKQLAKQFGYR
jgi:hypothetical protein